MAALAMAEWGGEEKRIRAGHGGKTDRPPPGGLRPPVTGLSLDVGAAPFHSSLPRFVLSC